MSSLSTIAEFLDQVLCCHDYEDEAFNGLQVQGASDERIVRRIATAVDCGLSTIEKAGQGGADLLIVHHGLLWGRATPYPLSGLQGDRIFALRQSRCSLYAAHLPLDGHATLGNAAQLARKIGLEDQEPFFFHKGRPLGVKGRFSSSLSLEAIEQRTSTATAQPIVQTLANNSREVRSVGIVTGSASVAIPYAQEEQLDLLLTGEPKQDAYHVAKDLRQNVIFAGHYATETFGVRALGILLQEQYGIEHFFIDDPTGI